MRRFSRLLTLAAALGVSAWMAASPAAAQDTPKQGGTLVVGTYQGPRHLNGAVQSGMATALPSTQLFASLVRFDDKWQPQPYLAKSWEWSDDHKALTLHLRDDAVFHDGKPLTSEDVAFSLMAIKADHPFKSMFDVVEEVQTPDAYTAVIKLKQPHPALLVALSPALAPILPKHVYGDGQDLKSHPRNSKDVVGSGPFKLKEFVPGKEVVLERFDKFFLKGKPYLDRVVIQINQDRTTLGIGQERGDIQMLPFVGEPVELKRAKENKNIVMLDKGYEGIGALSWIGFNLDNKYLKDQKVREAIAYSLDRNFITKALTMGFSQPAYGPIVSSSPFATEDVEHFKLNLDKAKKLLDEAGYKPGANGERFKLTIDPLPGTSALSKNVAEYARAQLKKIGIGLEVRSAADFPSWAKTVANHEFDLITDIVWNWGDPVIGVNRTYMSTNIRPVVWTNTQSYRNPKVDELLTQAGVETDEAKRKSLYAEAQKRIVADLPVYFLAQVPYRTLVLKNVGNPPTSIWGPLSPWDEVYLK